jgi:hypothetical protein
MRTQRRFNGEPTSDDTIATAELQDTYRVKKPSKETPKPEVFRGEANTVLELVRVHFLRVLISSAFQRFAVFK